VRRARLVAGLAVAGAALLACWAQPSAADGSATRAEVAALARQAVDDDDALAELRTITEVDGRPVDLDAVTRSMGDDRAARLEALAATFDTALRDDPGAQPAKARRSAERVLDDDKYDPQRLPKPFKGALEWMADRVRPIGRAFRPIADVVEAIPGGGYLLLGGLAAGTAWLIFWFAHRRSRAAVADEDARWRLVDPSQDPTELDRAADAAEAAGDHSRSVRLRYEAGLVRLDRAGRISLRPATTAAEVAAHVGDATLAQLTSTFEQVVYGGRDATAADAAAARRGWADLLAVGARR